MTLTYYATNIKDIYEAVKEHLKKHSYKKIQLVSVSKSFLAATYIFSKLQDDFPSLHISALGASGIATFKHESQKIIPSVVNMNIFIDLIPSIKDTMHEMQSIAFNLKTKNNNFFNYIVGKNSQMDIFQVQFLEKGLNDFKIHMLNFSKHSILIPLTIPAGKDKAYLEEKYAKLNLQDDLKHIDQSLVGCVDEIWDIYQSKLSVLDFL